MATKPRMQAKTAGELDAIAASGAVLRECLDLIAAEAKVGVTTAALDEIAEEFIRSRGGTGAFKGYHGYPATITASINEQIVHGIPDDYALREGDIASLDCGVVLDGWVSDAALTVPVGQIADESTRLLQVTRESLEAGIAACVAGNTVGDIGHAVETVVAGAGYSVVRALVGHGVGRAMHEEPQVPNYGVPGAGPTLIEGLVIAIEPMVTVGSHEVATASDGWTVSTADDSLSAHFEHTVAATAEGPRILTA